VQKRYFSGGNDTSRISEKLASLKQFSKQHSARIIDRPLYSLICQKELLLIAYNNIKSKPGNMTPGICPDTLDGISFEWLDKTTKNLKNESFQFKPGRRIQIPKKKNFSKGLRPLTITSPRDKIVQEAIRIILEIVFEPGFVEESHGFRSGKSCHSALKSIYFRFKGVCWVIEGDIEKCFDTIEHHRLMKIIEMKIKDRRFTHLIWKSLRAGHFEFKKFFHSLTGTPQGSIISPILCNIYMNDFDQHILEIKRQFDLGTKPKRNNEYSRLSSLLARAKLKGDMKEVKRINKQRKHIPSIVYNDSNFKRLYYVRYADDWIIGIRGSYLDTVSVKKKIENKLQGMGLKLNLDKTSITSLAKEKVLFLGIHIFRSHVQKVFRDPKGWKKRLPLGIKMTAPLNIITKKLKEAGFISKTFNPTPKFIWMFRSKDEIIYLYNSVLQGYSNYYSFVHNRCQLISRLMFIIKFSCAKLLAAKFKTGVPKIFKRFGRNFEKEGKIKLIKLSYQTQPYEFKTGQVKDYVQAIFQTKKSIANLDNLSCIKCQSTFKVEMHHVRKLADLRPNIRWIDKEMAKSNRKQIPLCRKCHKSHHYKKKKNGFLN
jgi:group II intron reverse transcriptase/maturase